MKKFLILLSIVIAFFLLFIACSNKNSSEACRHQASADLDKGNYDAVLASSCADTMQMGAAYFGKAGYDITNVLNRFVDANSSNASDTDLTIYMTALTGDVDGSTLTYLDSAKTAYDSVPDTSASYKDAQFYIGLVDAVESLALIKIMLPGSVNPDGTLNTSCDQNANGVPDDGDATACVLRTSAGQACSNMTIVTDTGTVQPLTLLNSAGTGTLTGQYRGLIIQGNTVAGGTTTTCPSPNQYKRLLFQQGGSWMTATFSGGDCHEVSPDNTRIWPCPMESNGTPVDLATTINTTLNSSVTALSSAITGTSGTDVQQSIGDIQAQACTTPCTTVCPGLSCPATCTEPSTMTYCSSQSIADYLETNLTQQ